MARKKNTSFEEDHENEEFDYEYQLVHLLARNTEDLRKYKEIIVKVIEKKVLALIPGSIRVKKKSYAFKAYAELKHGVKVRLGIALGRESLLLRSWKKKYGNSTQRFTRVNE